MSLFAIVLSLASVFFFECLSHFNKYTSWPWRMWNHEMCVWSVMDDLYWSEKTTLTPIIHHACHYYAQCKHYETFPSVGIQGNAKQPIKYSYSYSYKCQARPCMPSKTEVSASFQHNILSLVFQPSISPLSLVIQVLSRNGNFLPNSFWCRSAILKTSHMRESYFYFDSLNLTRLTRNRINPKIPRPILRGRASHWNDWQAPHHLARLSAKYRKGLGTE